jgi:hypothetical protein
VRKGKASSRLMQESVMQEMRKERVRMMEGEGCDRRDRKTWWERVRAA